LRTLKRASSKEISKKTRRMRITTYRLAPPVVVDEKTAALNFAKSFTDVRTKRSSKIEINGANQGHCIRNEKDS
jgi:hypothetical protein